jgi:hypothetical protein
MIWNIYTEEFLRIRNNFFLLNKKHALSEPGYPINLRVKVHLVEEAKGGPSKLLLSFLFLILRHAYRPNGNSQLDHNASIDADFLKEVPFGVSIFAKKFLGVIFAPKIEKNFHHCTSMKFLNNF